MYFKPLVCLNFLLLIIHSCVSFERSVHEKWHTELMENVFGGLFSPQYKKPDLYSCILVQEGKKPECCFCDDQCFYRRDCCIDVDFKTSPYPPEVYLQHITAKMLKQYGNGTCLPILGDEKQTPLHTLSRDIQYVYVINKCFDGTQCIVNYGRKVISRSNGHVYLNKLCAKCNNVEDYSSMEITLSGCENTKSLLLNNSQHNTEDPLLNVTQIETDLTFLKGCKIFLGGADSKSVLPCPFGAISRPNPFIYMPKLFKCNKFEFEVCHSYFAVVRGSDGGYYANPHCVKCLPEKSKATAPSVRCRTLAYNTTTRNNTNTTITNTNNNNNNNTPIIIRVKTGSQTISITHLNRRESKNNKIIVKRICKGDFVYDALKFQCVPAEDLQRFDIYPTTTTTTKIASSTKSTNASRNLSTMHPPSHYTGDDKDFKEFIKNLYAVQSYFFPPLVLISICCLVVTAITYSLLTGLQHTPGKIVIAICCVQLLYYVLQLVCLKRSFYVSITVHWCVLAKYLLILALVYELWKMNVHLEEQQDHQHGAGVVLYVIFAVLVAFVIVATCAWQNGVVRYGEGLYCLMGSVEGRVYSYLLPILLISLVGLVVLMYLNHLMKDWHREFLNSDTAILLENAINLSLYLLCIAFAIDSLAAVYTEEEKEVYQLVDGVVYFIFCLLNGLQGLLMCVVFVGKKFILMTYKKKLHDVWIVVRDICCCGCMDDDDVGMEDRGWNDGRNEVEMKLMRRTSRT